MSSDDLVCAACGGRVAEARCATCRASRELLREPLPMGPFLLAALVCLLLLVLLAG